MTAAHEKLRRDVVSLPIQVHGAPILGYVLVAVAADPSGEPLAVRSIALPDDASDRDRVLEVMRDALTHPIEGNE